MTRVATFQFYDGAYLMEVKPQFHKIVQLIWNSFSDACLKRDASVVLVTVIKEGVWPLDSLLVLPDWISCEMF